MRDHHRLRISQSGITQIEIIMVITVIAVLASAAIPSINTILNQQMLTGSSNALLSDLNLARQSAITRSTRVVICPITTTSQCSGDNQWSNGWMIFADDNRDARHNNNEDILRISHQDTELSMQSNGRRYFRFDANGMSLGLPGSIYVCSPPQQNHAKGNRIVISNVGRIRMEPLLRRCG